MGPGSLQVSGVLVPVFVFPVEPGHKNNIDRGKWMHRRAREKGTLDEPRKNGWGGSIRYWSASYREDAKPVATFRSLDLVSA